MARPPSRKVTRAAQTGGGRTSRGSRPWLYWAALALVVVLGTAGVWVSRDQRMTELASESDLTRPRRNEDHWHAAYGVYICDKFEAAITDQADPEGVHTHGDGVIHIHPTLRRSAGENARLEKFTDAVRMTLTDEELKMPGGKTYREGRDKCGDKPGVVQVKVKGQEKPVTENVAKLRFTRDRMVMTIAFAPLGAEIPDAPSEPQLDNLSDVGPNTTLPAGIEPAPTDTSAPTETTAPASDTTAPATSTP